MARILVVDDEERILRLVSDYLKNDGHEVLTASDGVAALEVFDDATVDLVILDIMMPKLDGWVVLRELRAKSAVRVILLTARGDERDELLGYELGVDDYIHKPFSPRLLTLRVRALLRRSTEVTEADLIVPSLDLRIDKKHHEVRLGNALVDLSPREFHLLAHFAAHPQEVFGRDQLLLSVWGHDYVGDERTVDTHVKKLRAKLGSAGDALQTVRGFGYRLDVRLG